MSIYIYILIMYKSHWQNTRAERHRHKIASGSSLLPQDPQKEIAKLDIPILIVQGTTDIQVSVSDANKLALANKNSQKQIIEGMNHILKESEIDRQKNIQTYSIPDLPLKKELTQVIVKFIEE